MKHTYVYSWIEIKPSFTQLFDFGEIVPLQPRECDE